jgi:hypothetical protein
LSGNLFSPQIQPKKWPNQKGTALPMKISNVKTLDIGVALLTNPDIMLKSTGMLGLGKNTSLTPQTGG